ncbi:hypothetical protein, partial [Streptomyces sp. NPDC006368]|uniref:hypothetical protein n=1 Tax=Streptomyces sp. NPDC006368 TaxID=3156760 RepID=UPI00339F5375
PATPTSGEATAPIRNEDVPSSADAEPAACGVDERPGAAPPWGGPAGPPGRAACQCRPDRYAAV